MQDTWKINRSHCLAMTALLLLLFYPRPTVPSPTLPAIRAAETSQATSGPLEPKSQFSLLLQSAAPRHLHRHHRPTVVPPIPAHAVLSTPLPPRISGTSYPTAHAGKRPFPQAVETPDPQGPEVADVGLSAEVSQFAVEAGEESHLVYVLLESRAAISPDVFVPPVRLSMVIDVSGSMFQAGKLECATAAVAAACAHMREGDQSSLTVFGQKAAVVVGMGSAFPAIADLEQLIRKAPVGRSTDLAEGIRTGLGQLAQSAKTEVSDDLLLVTDGVTQNGDQCRLLCKGAGAHHVAISTIGLGVDVNAGLLRDLAEGGRYTFVSSPEELSTIFDQEVRRTQKPVHNARMRLKLMRGVEVRHAYGLTASRRDFGTPEAKGGWLTLPLGDLRQGETVSTLLELEVPAGKSGHSSILQARVEHDGPDPEKSGSPTLKPSIQYANRSSAASRRVLDMVDSCTRFYARR